MWTPRSRGVGIFTESLFWVSQLSCFSRFTLKNGDKAECAMTLCNVENPVLSLCKKRLVKTHALIIFEGYLALLSQRACRRSSRRVGQVYRFASLIIKEACWPFFAKPVMGSVRSGRVVNCGDSYCLLLPPCLSSVNHVSVLHSIPHGVLNNAPDVLYGESR